MGENEAAESELVPAVEGGLRELKELAELCGEAGIATEIGMEACDKPGCAPKAKLMIARGDAEKLAVLMRDRWKAMVAAEGIELVEAKVGEDGEPPCPACGTAAPLVE